MILTEQTIAAGTHVVLDVRAGRLTVTGVIGTTSIVVEEYALADQDAALDMFAYLEQYKGRFASVRVV